MQAEHISNKHGTYTAKTEKRIVEKYQTDIQKKVTRIEQSKNSAWNVTWWAVIFFISHIE